MAKFTRWLLKYRYIVLGVLILLLALSVVGSMLVQKESDVLSYLDKDSDTVKGKEILNQEFSIVGDCTLGLSFLTKEEVGEIIDKFEQSDKIGQKKVVENGVEVNLLSKMVWIGTFDDLNQLEEFIDTSEMMTMLGNKFHLSTDNIDTYVVSMYFIRSGSDNAVIDALDEAENIIRDTYSAKIKAGELNTDVDHCYYIGGMAQNARVLVDSSVNDMPKFVAAAVVCVFIILFVSTNSYLEPIIFLATLGISILLNMGTNLIAGNPMGTISTITSSCASILQLAISMDYSIFLMHTYYEERRTGKDPKEALISAMPKTLKSIMASALTTIGGFVALFFMTYGMGYDLGFVLAKGVLLSLLAVLFVQPILILFCRKIIDKTHHEWIITPRLNFVGKTITNKAIAIFVLVLCIAIAIPSSILQSKAPLNYITMTQETPEDEMSLPEREITALNNQIIMCVPITYENQGTADSLAARNVLDLTTQYDFIEKIKQVGKPGDTASNSIAGYGCSEVTDVFSLGTMLTEEDFAALKDSPFYTAISSQLESQLYSSFISNLGDTSKGSQHYMLYTINLTGAPEDVESYNAMLKIRNIANEIFGADKVYITGLVQGAYELYTVTPDDFTLVNVLSAVIVFVVLLLTFRKPIMSVILLLVIETGIWANLTLVYLIGDKINFIAYLIVSAIQLGATVDYAILFTSKYYEEKEKCTGIVAVKNAVHRSAPSVITSAAILIFACVAVNTLTTNVIVAQITRLIAIGTVFSLILVFTLLPSILSLKERATRRIYIKRGKGDPDEGKDDVPIYDKKAQAKGLAKAAKVGLKGVIFAGVSAADIPEESQSAPATVIYPQQETASADANAVFSSEDNESVGSSSSNEEITAASDEQVANQTTVDNTPETVEEDMTTSEVQAEKTAESDVENEIADQQISATETESSAPADNETAATTAEPDMTEQSREQDTADVFAEKPSSDDAESKDSEISSETKTEEKAAKEKKTAPEKKPAAKKSPVKRTATKAENTKKPAAAKKTEGSKKPSEAKKSESATSAANTKANVTLLFGETPEPGNGKFVIIKDKGNPERPYKYQLKANNGQILYESEGYKIKPKAKQIEVFRSTVNNGTYTIDEEKNGTFRYKLFKADGTMYGVGEGYKTRASAESAIESVRKFANNANFIEDNSDN